MLRTCILVKANQAGRLAWIMANNMKDTIVEEELLISMVAKLTVIKDNRTATFQKTVIEIN